MLILTLLLFWLISARCPHVNKEDLFQSCVMVRNTNKASHIFYYYTEESHCVLELAGHDRDLDCFALHTSITYIWFGSCDTFAAEFILSVIFNIFVRVISLIRLCMPVNGKNAFSGNHFGPLQITTPLFKLCLWKCKAKYCECWSFIHDDCKCVSWAFFHRRT